MSVRVNNKLPSFKSSLYGVLADALREAAGDTLRAAKSRAPYRKGQLRGNSEVKQLNHLHQRVSFWIEYARFQEFGGDSRKRVRRYSTPGTGARFLKSAGDEQLGKAKNTFKKHAARARA